MIPISVIVLMGLMGLMGLMLNALGYAILRNNLLLSLNMRKLTLLLALIPYLLGILLVTYLVLYAYTVFLKSVFNEFKETFKRD